MVLYGFGGHCLNITDNCVDLNHVSRPITLSLLTWKASNLVKWQPWTWSLVVMSIYWLVKIWNSPQFPAQFRNGQLFELLKSRIIVVFIRFSFNFTSLSVLKLRCPRLKKERKEILGQKIGRNCLGKCEGKQLAIDAMLNQWSTWRLFHLQTSLKWGTCQQKNYLILNLVIWSFSKETWFATSQSN